LTTGFNNFGIGFEACYSLQTGHDNYAVGNLSMNLCVSGAYNTSIGLQALYHITTESNNVALGFQALTSLGAGAGAGGGGGGACLAAGSYAFTSLQTGSGCIAMGFNAAAAFTTSSGQDTFVGLYSGGNATTSYGYNTFLGAYSGINIGPGVAYTTILGPWRGPGANVTSVVAIAGGNDWNMPALDCGYTKSYGASGPWVWSFNTRKDTAAGPIGLHVYNTQDASPPTNYERACLDWNLTANVFRLAYQAGGSGAPSRLIAIDGFQKAGAPAAGDLPSGTCALINDTSGGQTWLAYNAAGTIRKVQLT
jgi:hypothetical protein